MVESTDKKKKPIRLSNFIYGLKYVFSVPRAICLKTFIVLKTSAPRILEKYVISIAEKHFDDCLEKTQKNAPESMARNMHTIPKGVFSPPVVFVMHKRNSF